MVNFKEHIRDIDKDFTSLYFAKYMLGEWGIQVGYKVIPEYLARMRKRLADYQILSEQDCCNELLEIAKLQSVYLVSGPSTICPVTTNLYGDYNGDFNNDYNN